ncbi:MAG: hypothetical protein H6686_08975 [Fibrobacteria bacterium]|nr:hypothetical protein [Fibrobacteria bacterium]
MSLERALDTICTGIAVSLDAYQPPLDTMDVIEAIGNRLASDSSEATRTTLLRMVNHYNPEGRWIRHPKTIAAFLQAVSGRPDDASKEALEYLVGRATPQSLSKFHAEILGELSTNPFRERFLLVARAKPRGALKKLRALAATDPAVTGSTEGRIALAANGDRDWEKEFTQAFSEATDPQEKQRLAEVLGWIGTRTTLRVLAEELRTPLVYRLGRVFQVPVWIDIAKALESHFPEAGLAISPASEEEYLAYEAFFQKEFAIHWQVERPPFEFLGPLEHGFIPAEPMDP